MNSIRYIAVLFVIALTFCAPMSVRACPLCADAIANSNSGNDADDVDQFPAAMNQSIYLMLGVPYAAFGVMGLMVYYGVRKNEEYRREHDETPA
jgi:hypothetical protein